MSDIKFACPACQQHISADQGYAGMEIACPACSARMIVPGTPVRASIPAPVPAPAYIPPPPSPAAAAAPTAAAGGCPSCGAALPRGAVICTQCGYNMATKQRMVGGRVVPPGKAMVHAGEEKWYQTPWPYLGGVLLFFVILLLLGMGNPLFKFAYIGALILYYVVLYIMVVIAAFRDSSMRGFMCLFPAFHFRFIFFHSENTLLKIMYGLLAAITAGIFILFKT
jgi:DNA-directed RNA polymerase subunit RPC12/RpoP